MKMMKSRGWAEAAELFSAETPDGTHHGYRGNHFSRAVPLPGERPRARLDAAVQRRTVRVVFDSMRGGGDYTEP